MAARKDGTTINWADTGPGWGNSITFSSDSIAPNAAVIVCFWPCLKGIGTGTAAWQCDTTTNCAGTGPITGSSIVFSPGSITINTAELAGIRPCWVMVGLAGVDGDGIAAALNPLRQPVSNCWIAVRRIHIGRIKQNTAELAGFRPCLKVA